MRPCNCGHWVASAARGSREARGHTQRHLKVLGGARKLPLVGERRAARHPCVGAARIQVQRALVAPAPGCRPSGSAQPGPLERPGDARRPASCRGLGLGQTNRTPCLGLRLQPLQSCARTTHRCHVHHSTHSKHADGLPHPRPDPSARAAPAAPRACARAHSPPSWRPRRRATRPPATRPP